MKKILTLSFRWWATWSNMYQKFERKFLKTVPAHNMKKWDKRTEPMTAWRNYIKSINLKHYGSDKWYMMFDVISAPERVVARGADDCDGFSILSHNFFGNHINWMGKVYKFDGIYAIIYGIRQGHATAVWKNIDGDDYYIVSNNEMFRRTSVTALFNYSADRQVKWIGKFDVADSGNISFREIEQF